MNVQAAQQQKEKQLPADLSPIPPDNPERPLTLAQPDNLPHIGLVGDTYTVTVAGNRPRDASA